MLSECFGNVIETLNNVSETLNVDPANGIFWLQAPSSSLFGISYQGRRLCWQTNSFRVSQAQHQSPSVEVVRDRYRDLMISRFQRQREGAILEGTSPVGKFSRSFLLPYISVGIHQFPVQEYPKFARPSNIYLLRLLAVGSDRRLQPCYGSLRLGQRPSIQAAEIYQPVSLRADGLPLMRSTGHFVIHRVLTVRQRGRS